MFCPECGKEVGAGGGFCSNCGAKVEGGSSASLALRSSGNQNLALIGSAILVVSFFMPWIDLGFISVSGFNLTKAASGYEKLLAIIAWLVPIGGGITAYFAYTKNTNATKAALITGAIAIIVWVWLFFSMGFEIRKMSDSFSDVFKAMGIGLYVLFAGIVCIGISLKSFFTNLFNP